MKRHIFAVLLGLLAVLSLAPSAPAQNATVSGDLSTIFHEQLQGDAFVRVRLRNYSGCVPRILGGGGIIAETTKEVSPDATGHFTTTLVGNDFVDVCGVTGRTFYTVEYWNNGIARSSANYQCNAGVCDLNTLATFNPPNPPPNILNAVLTNPLGSQTIAQPLGTTLSVNRFEGVHYADRFSSIQAAITDAGSNGVVYVPAGAYPISSTIVITNLSKFNLILAPGAILTAQGSLGANPMLTVSGGLSTSDIHIVGGEWNAASIGSDCIKVDSTSTGGPARVEISGGKCSNTTSHGVSVNAGTTPTTTFDLADITIHDFSILNTGGHGISASSINGLRIASVLVDGTTDGNGIKISQSMNVSVTNSSVKNFRIATANTGTGIECVFCTNATFTGNTVYNFGATDSNSFNGLFMDTVIGGTISGNVVYGGKRGIKVELSKGVTVSGNTVKDVTDYGIWVVGRSEYQQKNALNATTNLTAASNVTLSVDAGDKQEGAGSVQAVIAAGFTTGAVFYNDFGSSQDWTSSSTNFNVHKLWIKSDTDIAAGVLQFQFSSSTALASPNTVINLPRILAGQWIRLELYDPIRWFLKQQSVRTWGIFATSDPGAITLHFDDYGIDHPMENDAVIGNTIERPGENGIRADKTLTNISIIGNIVVDPGYNVPYSDGGIGIILDSAQGGEILSHALLQGNQVSMTSAGYFNDGSNPYGVVLRTLGGGTITDVVISGNSLYRNITTPIRIDGAATRIVQAGNIIDTNGDYRIAQTTGRTRLTTNGTTAQLRLEDSDDLTSFTEILSNKGGAGETLLDINPFTVDAAKDSLVRMFRAPNTSGNVQLQLFKGDGTSTQTITLNAASGLGTFTGGIKIGAGTSFTGQTGSGSNIVSDTSPSVQTQLSINGATSTTRQLNFSTSGSTRWIVRANGTAEGGANAGSDWELSARDDSGALLSTTILCIRSTSNCTFNGGVIGASFRSSTTNVASAGAVRLAKTDAVNLRNNANSGDINGISLDGSDVVQIGGNTNGVRIGSAGAALKKILTATSVIDFAAQAANTCTDSAGITVTGAADGDNVAVSGPAADWVANVTYSGYVSAVDTVKVRLCNVATGASADPASGTFRVTVKQF